MANKKISELTALGRDAANTDLFEIETAGGQSRKATGAEVAALLTAFSLTVEEQDAAPSVAGVVKIKFPNASLSDEGSGVVSVTFPASYTQEQIEDIVGAMVSGNTESGISVTYDDTNGKLDFAVTAANIQTLLDGIGSTRGSILYRGASGWAILAPGTSGNVLTSNGSGADPSYQAAAAGYSDEQAQDAVGAMAETNSLQYTDATPELKVKRQMSITADASGLKLDGDSAAPGNSKLYGTNGSGVKGWYDQPSGGGGGSTTGVEAHRTENLTLSNNAWTTIVFTTEDRDQNNEYNNSTGEFTAGATGWYNWGFFSEIIDGDIYPLNVYARVSKDSGSGYSEFFRFYSFQHSNGGPKKYAPHGGGPIYLTSGDKLKWEIYQDGNFQNLQYTSSRLFIVRMP